MLSLWIKNNAPEKPLRMVVLCTTVGGESDPVQLVLMSDRTAGLASGGCYAYGIGEACNSGVWERVQVDVAAAIAACSNNGDQLTAIHGVMVLCADASVDEVELSAGLMCRTYQVSPGAELSGVLAVQTGLEGGEGLTIPGAKVYYQYNDLGTVHATTDEVGARVGLWIPDFYGNYAWASAGSPARPELGLTGKLWDQDAGLYYFHARWLDPQRGRWMSEEPFGFDGPNLYQFAFNNGLYYYDLDGYKIEILDEGENKKYIEEALEELKRNSATAKMLIEDLEKHENTVFIRRTRGDNNYESASNLVWFNPDKWEIYPECRTEWSHRPPEIGLAHELIHAHHDLNKPLPGTDNDEENNDEENKTIGLEAYSDSTMTENTIRKEYTKFKNGKGLPRRTKH